MIEVRESFPRWNELLDLYTQAPWVRNATKARIQDLTLRSHLRYLYDDAQLVGVARFITDSKTVTFLCDLIVDESHRNKGYGKELMQSVLRDDVVKNTTVVLLTQAEGFYDSLGFQKRVAMVRKP